MVNMPLAIFSISRMRRNISFGRKTTRQQQLSRAKAILAETPINSAADSSDIESAAGQFADAHQWRIAD